MTDDPIAAADVACSDALEAAIEASVEDNAGETVPPPSTATNHPPSDAAPTLSPKLADLLKLISRKRGATLAELTRTMRWQPHTARAALSRLRKMGYKISRAQIGNRMAYRAERI